MDWKHNVYRVGSNTDARDSLPTDPDELSKFVGEARKRIEPWLSAVFQAEHLNLLVGTGLTAALAKVVGSAAAGMGKVTFGTKFDAQIDAHAQATAKTMNRGDANVEDQFRSAMAVLAGLEIISPGDATLLSDAIDRQMTVFLRSILSTEKSIADQPTPNPAEGTLQSFLLSFASRSASRDRLHVFTTNYDRLIEHGCDLAGIRTVDRFVGALNPVFRSSRVDVDFHYNPPGIRGEPRFMEGVIRFTKLHGSLDWHFASKTKAITRKGIPFGASIDHSDVPKKPLDSMMIYPNAAKDMETNEYPYAELFRDFAASICRPNAVLITYGYGFGDDHINRVIADMLKVPSTHLVIITYSTDDRLKHFCADKLDAQTSLLAGPHFADITILTENYLPKPALDYITGRMADLLKRRLGTGDPTLSSSATGI